MSKWQFYLDGSLVNDPIGFDDSVINLERDQDIDGLFVKYTNKLKWYGAAYTYIKSVFEANFCNLISVKIYYKCNDGSYDLLFSGTMILSEIEFDEQRCEINATIEDDSFSGRITRNKNIKAKVSVALSKNAVVITPVTPASIVFFAVSTGNNIAGLRDCYSAYDCFRYLIDFMTDGTVSFASDYFSTGDGSNVYVTTGKEIRTFNHSEIPMVSFKDLFVNLRKKYNISFSIKLIAGQRVFRIEDEAYFYQTTALTTLPNVPDIQVKVDDRRLYANVKVGNSNTNDDYPALHYPVDIHFLNWKQEQYHVLGDCNNDISLDLVNDWIIDSNSIEDILVNGNDANDEAIFLITSDNGTNANKGNPFGLAPPYFYNRELMNDVVIPRWLGGIPNSIAAYLGNGNDEFEAHRTADTAIAGTFTSNTAQFAVEVSDPNNRYNNATYKYIAPENGMYVFESKVQLGSMAIITGPNEDYNVTIIIRRRTTGGATLLASYTATGSSQSAVFSLINNTGAIYLDATDEVTVDIEVDNFITGSLKSTSYFKCTDTETGGGIFADFETKSIRPFVYNFKYPVTYSDFKNVLDNYSDNIQFYKKQNKYFNGWLEKLVYPVKTGLAQWTIISEKY